MRINIVYCNCNVWVTSKNKNFICMIGFFSFWSQLDALGFRTLNFFRYHRKVDRPSGGENHSGCPARRPAGRRNSMKGCFVSLLIRYRAAKEGLVFSSLWISTKANN